MVASPRKTGKRGAVRAGPGAARQDAGALRRAKRRAAILAAALEEFAARGFAATRLDDVAAARASPRARSTSTSATRRACSRNSYARC